MTIATQSDPLWQGMQTCPGRIPAASSCSVCLLHSWNYRSLEIRCYQHPTTILDHAKIPHRACLVHPRRKKVLAALMTPTAEQGPLASVDHSETKLTTTAPGHSVVSSFRFSARPGTSSGLAIALSCQTG